MAKAFVPMRKDGAVVIEVGPGIEVGGGEGLIVGRGAIARGRVIGS